MGGPSADPVRQRFLSYSGIPRQNVVQVMRVFNTGRGARCTNCPFVTVRVDELIITFYQNDGGHPGAVIARQTLACADTAGNLACTIRTVRLKGGLSGRRYWLSIVANCDYDTCGEWGWVQDTTTHDDPGQWENPAGGLGVGCTSWSDTSSCNLQTGGADDFAFDLRGETN